MMITQTSKCSVTLEWLVREAKRVAGKRSGERRRLKPPRRIGAVPRPDIQDVITSELP